MLGQLAWTPRQRFNCNALYFLSDCTTTVFMSLDSRGTSGDNNQNWKWAVLLLAWIEQP